MFSNKRYQISLRTGSLVHKLHPLTNITLINHVTENPDKSKKKIGWEQYDVYRLVWYRFEVPRPHVSAEAFTSL